MAHCPQRLLVLGVALEMGTRGKQTEAQPAHREGNLSREGCWERGRGGRGQDSSTNFLHPGPSLHSTPGAQRTDPHRNMSQVTQLSAMTELELSKTPNVNNFTSNREVPKGGGWSDLTGGQERPPAPFLLRKQQGRGHLRRQPARTCVAPRGQGHVAPQAGGQPV